MGSEGIDELSRDCGRQHKDDMRAPTIVQKGRHALRHSRGERDRAGERVAVDLREQLEGEAVEIVCLVRKRVAETGKRTSVQIGV